MQSVFDTRGVVFQPEQVSALLAAYQIAMAEVGPGIPENTERQLGKVVITMARRTIEAGHDLDVEALARDAVGFISQLRSSRWLF